ncbi:(2Fe-2S)-binding protein (plasmid) [Thioclava sp. 'Guangxiensis']|uniref:(2Fe-2S)-binding protein n=1 Tax=Thioclava sp. 'Guangxiensis' TaxID=3149044 RepID=UPI0032C3DCB1
MAPSTPRRIETGRLVTFTFEGQPVEGQVGESVAAALTAAGIRNLRDSVVSGAPRGIYCMMGACFDCLVQIDGVPNRQACMTEVREGLEVRRQVGAAEVTL